jgi:hypothetical protein
MLLLLHCDKRNALAWVPICDVENPSRPAGDPPMSRLSGASSWPFEKSPDDRVDGHDRRASWRAENMSKAARRGISAIPAMVDMESVRP